MESQMTDHLSDIRQLWKNKNLLPENGHLIELLFTKRYSPFKVHRLFHFTSLTCLVHAVRFDLLTTVISSRVFDLQRCDGLEILVWEGARESWEVSLGQQ